MKTNVNFDVLLSIIEELRKGKEYRNASNLNIVKTELNRFFSDSECIEIIMNENVDKPMFGIMAIPYNYIQNKNLSIFNRKRFDKYYLEIDSKLFEEIRDISSRELVAIMLYEIGNIVLDARPSRDVANAVELITAKERVIFKNNNSANGLITIGAIKSIRNLYSIFEDDGGELISNDFIRKCGLNEELEKAYHKVSTTKDAHNKNDSRRFAVLIWAVKVYSSFETRKESIIEVLEESLFIEPSIIMQRILKNVIAMVKNETYEEGTEISDVEGCEFLTEKGSFFKNLKYAGISDVENDLYEYQLRINNVNNKEEAMEILRALNRKISLIEDYLNNEYVAKNRFQRLSKVRDKYAHLRDELLAMEQYDKQWGLYIKYPKIRSKYDN